VYDSVSVSSPITIGWYTRPETINDEPLKPIHNLPKELILLSSLTVMRIPIQLIWKRFDIITDDTKPFIELIDKLLTNDETTLPNALIDIILSYSFPVIVHHPPTLTPHCAIPVSVCLILLSTTYISP
jgi:hypothetical protein